MKVVLINKSDSTGGAAVACQRLAVALHKEAVDVNLLVEDQKHDHSFTTSTGESQLKKAANFGRFVWERLYFARYEKSKDVRFAFSPAVAGQNIARHPLVQQADILHLHWINQGFLSMKSIRQLLALKKPMVWTMHDCWTFTGGCHYPGGCKQFLQKCGNCPFLKQPSENDLSAKLWQRKREIFRNQPIVFTGCSQWMAGLALQSTLLGDMPVTSVPNPIDTQLFAPKDKAQACAKFQLPEDKFLLLFGAANINDSRKGLKFLVRAIRILQEKFPQFTEAIHLVIFGKNTETTGDLFSVPATHLPYLDSHTEIAQLYSAADAFILPSLQDNLPNTVMESLSCGTPVVAFSIGGLPEMIRHKQTGYLAQAQSAKDLAEGIFFLLTATNYAEIRQNARQFVEKFYSEKAVAQQYIEIYKKIQK